MIEVWYLINGGVDDIVGIAASWHAVNDSVTIGSGSNGWTIGNRSLSRDMDIG